MITNLYATLIFRSYASYASPISNLYACSRFTSRPNSWLCERAKGGAGCWLLDSVPRLPCLASVEGNGGLLKQNGRSVSKIVETTIENT
eukprot:SAG22_NODE_5153_length_1076_cov_1.012282_1_plen_88_part_10